MTLNQGHLHWDKVNEKVGEKFKVCACHIKTHSLEMMVAYLWRVFVLYLGHINKVKVIRKTLYQINVGTASFKHIGQLISYEQEEGH